MKKRGDSFLAPASILRRAFAFLMDMIIADMIVLYPFKAAMQRLLPSFSSYEIASAYIKANSGALSSMIILFVIMGCVLVFYFSYFEYKINQTPGKMLLGIYTVPEGDKAGFANYLLSNIIFIPLLLFVILWIIDIYYMFNSAKNQRLMEKIGKVITVQYYEIK